MHSSQFIWRFHEEHLVLCRTAGEMLRYSTPTNNSIFPSENLNVHHFPFFFFTAYKRQLNLWEAREIVFVGAWLVTKKKKKSRSRGLGIMLQWAEYVWPRSAGHLKELEDDRERATQTRKRKLDLLKHSILNKPYYLYSCLIRIELVIFYVLIYFLEFHNSGR